MDPKSLLLSLSLFPLLSLDSFGGGDPPQPWFQRSSMSMAFRSEVLEPSLLCDVVGYFPGGSTVHLWIRAGLGPHSCNELEWVLSQVVLEVKNPPAKAGDGRDTGSIPVLGRSPGQGHGNPLRILAWRISWTELPGGLQSIGPQRVRHDWSSLVLYL